MIIESLGISASGGRATPSPGSLSVLGGHSRVGLGERLIPIWSWVTPSLLPSA